MSDKSFLDKFFTPNNMGMASVMFWGGKQDYLIDDETILKLQSIFLRTINTSIKIKGFIYKSPKMQKVMNHLYRIAKEDTKVLILGSSGTGKESIAGFLNDLSNKSDELFTAVNCANFTEDIANSELFGHEEGSFTGASKQHKGIFETYEGGTVFLDEVHTLHPSIQAKILRYVETFKFKRLGGNEEIQSKTRMIFASNVDLESSDKRKEVNFIHDLYYRISEDTIKIPSLSERGFDIFHLINFFLNNEGSDSILKLETDSELIVHKIYNILNDILDDKVLYIEGTLIKAHKDKFDLIHQMLTSLKNENLENYAILRTLRESSQWSKPVISQRSLFIGLSTFLNFELQYKRTTVPILLNDIKFSFPDVIDIMHNSWEGNIRNLIKYIREYSLKQYLGNVVQRERPVSFERTRDIFYYLHDIGVQKEILMSILNYDNRIDPTSLSQILTLSEDQPDPLRTYLSIINLFFGTMEIHNGQFLAELINNNENASSKPKYFSTILPPLGKYLKNKEKNYLINIITQFKNLKKKDIAEKLEIDYSTFYNKCKEYEIDIDKIQGKN